MSKSASPVGLHPGSAFDQTLSFSSCSAHVALSNRQRPPEDDIDATIRTPTPLHQAEAVYATLVMLETKCRGLVNELNTTDEVRLTSTQWRNFVNLHEALLCEHFEFLTLSCRPFAPPELRLIHSKRDLLQRMSLHGVHEALALMRSLEPHSEEYIIEFSLFAYKLIGALWEAVPMYRDQLEETLGDLAVYRVSVSQSIEETHIWTSVAVQWYGSVVHRAPGVGRLHLALGTLERPCLRKLALFWKSRQSYVPTSDEYVRATLKSLDIPLAIEPDGTFLGMEIAELCALQFFQLLHSTELPWTRSFEMAECVADTLNYLRVSDLTGYGAPLATLCVASMLGFGSHEGYRRDFVATIDRHVKERLEDRHHTVTASTHAGAAFGFTLFNHILATAEQSAESADMMTFVHVVMAYLSSYFHVYGFYPAPYSFRISWLDLRRFLNHIIVLHDVEVPDPAYGARAFESRRTQLPDDFWIMGSFWSPYPAVDLLDAADVDHSRAYRIVALAMEISMLTGAFTFDRQERKF